MEVVEKLLDQIPNINTIYFWIIFLMVLIFVNKIEISNENIKEKMILSYLLLLVLRYVNVISIKFAIIFSILFYFIFIELFYLSKNDKKILNKSYFYLKDFSYKLIFKYYYHIFVLSLFIASKFAYKLLLPFHLMIKCPFDLHYVLIALSIIIYICNVGLILENSFETLSIGEISEKIENILPFVHYKHDKRLEDFATILTYYEDKSFFKRKNSFNWVSFPFIKYKFNRIKSNRKNKIYSIKIIGPVLKFIITTIIMISKTIKLICTNIYKIIKVLFNKFFSKNKIRNIRNVIGGYSTIEMQLIRTLANTSGYNKLIHRKVYEIIYSQIFFKSLYNYFKYYHYHNLEEEYRYYLIHLYILCAPTFINGKRYNNITELYKNRKDILEITNEEFYVYCLGLANKKISDKISVPYNDRGYALIRVWLQDPVNRATNNGVIDPGVTLSESQKAQIYNETGKDLTTELWTQGYAIHVEDAGSAVRVGRNSPNISVYYTYGGSVNRIEVASTAVL